MNKKERVDAALRGETVDRVPASVWGHDYVREWSAQGLAEATVENFTRSRCDPQERKTRRRFSRRRPSGAVPTGNACAR